MTKELPDSTVLWRYMSFWKFAKIVMDNELYFARPTTFNDRWEGLVPPSFLRNVKRSARKGRVTASGVSEWAEDLRRRERYRKLTYFVNCWHISKHESDAMWRAYGLAPDGVAIRSTIGLLKEHICDWTDCGHVIYYDPARGHNTRQRFHEDIIRYKRIAFKSENEFRIWKIDDDMSAKITANKPIDESELKDGITRGISHELITGIVAAPGASDGFLSSIQRLCEVNGRVASLLKLVKRSYSDRTWDSFTE
jgi:hypothetical protein